MPSVAAVIPTYDRLSTLPRALASVLAQTRPPDEIVVVDDGSTDGTVDWLVERHPHVRVVRQARRGVSAARNRGIRESRSQWLAFLDSDDEWAPEKLGRQLSALQASPGHRLCHSDERWMRGGVRVNPRRIHRKGGGRIFRSCLAGCVIAPSSALVRRDLFDEIGDFDESLPACEDYDLWLRVTAFEPVLYVPEPLVTRHGGRPDQLSVRTPALDRYRIRALEKILAHPRLAPGDREAAREKLLEKIGIYASGVRKRGRESEVEIYERKRKRWARERETPDREPVGESGAPTG